MKGHSSCNHHSSAQRRRPWTPEEDLRLRKCIEKYGQGNWHLVPSKAGIKRCRKSCRLRWFNYLCPNIKRGEFGDDEDDLIIRLHKLLGNRWSLIAGRLPGRTANDVKNHWNCHLRKKIDDHEKATPRRVEVIKPQPHFYSPSSIRPKDLQLPRNQHHPENEMAMSMSMTPSWDTDESTKWWDSLLGKEEDETLFFGNSTPDEVVEEQPSSSWFEGIEPISQTDGVLLAGVCGWDDFSSDTGFCSDWLDMP